MSVESVPDRPHALLSDADLKALRLRIEKQLKQLGLKPTKSADKRAAKILSDDLREIDSEECHREWLAADCFPVPKID